MSAELEAALRSELNFAQVEASQAHARACEKDAEIARLREALQFYADPELYDFESGCSCDLCCDTGDRARKALEGKT